ncbi:MAG: SusC/RagA family TonB-linked outer membrane protein [Bacteroidales bacterium]|nr:SusC/RagA family TonB-linked outer membrane protein [Bacteroidales bacterium]
MHNKSSIFLTLALLLYAAFLHPAGLAAQSGTVGGSVASSDGEPLAGVVVQCKGAVAVTGSQGEFTIKAKVGDVLEFSLLGFKKQTYVVRAINSGIMVTMEDDTTFLDEIVVVGYGTQKRKDVVGAIEQISGEKLTSRSNPNAVRSIQGQIPGLTLQFDDGKPNHGATLNIRGNTQSIGSGGSCLVLVDGVESGLDNVNPEDIQTISVLKDASSCAIYGARGAFGVILVTTKTPSAGSVKVKYSGSMSVLANTVDFDFVTDPVYWTQQALDSYKGCYGYYPTGFNNLFPYSDEWFTELKRRYQDPGYSEYHNPVGVSASGQWQYYGSTDWWKLMYKDYTTNTQHEINVSGGNDKVRFHISGRYFAQDGIYNTDFDDYWKASVLAKVQVNATKWWTIDDNINFYRSYYLQPVLFQIAQSVKGQIEHQAYPMTVPYNPDGTFTDAAVCVGYSAFVTGNSYQLNHAFKMGNNLNNTFHILKDQLDFHLNFAYAFNWSRRDRRTNVYAFGTGPESMSSRPAYDDFEELWINQDYLKGEAFLAWNPKFTGSAHSLKMTAGANLEWKTNHGTVGLERNAIREDKANFQLMGTDYYYLNDYNSNDWSFLGFFGRLNYNFKDRYLLEMSARADGSSKFPVNSRWGFFPSLSLGWRFSEEPFLSGAREWLDNAKVRLSAGSLGNGSVAAYAYTQNMTVGTSSVYINGQKVSVTSAPDPIPSNLTWERVTTYDVGLDIDVLSNRLNLVADYYVKNTTDMYTVGKTLPAVYGNSSPKGNNADMRTYGWELSLAWRDNFNVGGKPFGYGVKGMLWDARSFITKYNNDTKILTDYYEGEELGEIWGLHVLGLFRDAADVANSADQSAFLTQNRRGNKFEAGDLKFADLDESGAINWGDHTADNPGDLRVIGNTNPRYCYGINLDMNWNGIGLSLFFQGVGKRDWYPGINCGSFWGKYARPYSMIPVSQIGKAWTEEDPDPNAFWPKLSSYLATDSIGTLEKVANDRYLVDASYCRLKNITLDYSFPRKLIGKMGLQGLRVFLSGENLFTWTPMHKWTTVFDPEVISAGDSDLNGVYNVNSKVDGTSYPMLKSVTLGLNVTF